MESAAFDYDLPAAAIAQAPAEPRDSSRLLIDGRPPRHATTADFPELVGPGDVVVLNDTRVLPARLRLRKPTGGRVEVLVLEPVDGPAGCDRDAWEALVRPSRRIADGTILVDDAGKPVLKVGARMGDGRRRVSAQGQSMEQLLVAHGEVPLPPYISRALDDPERYQTVYAAAASSVAAPTAGLHLTEVALDRCRERGARVCRVELSVGVGTFRPLETPLVHQHRMHSERYLVPQQTWSACQEATRVVAVGTTVVRSLETVARTGRLAGRTDLFLQPGDDIAVVDALLTNFHMPRSTLLVMLEAFMGPRWRHLYEVALAENYRFLSFGDAMFVDRGAKTS